MQSHIHSRSMKPPPATEAKIIGYALLMTAVCLVMRVEPARNARRAQPADALRVDA
jgi:hypothetical protein